MPTRLNYLLERVPLPSLRIYTFLSSSLLLGNVIYIHKSLTNPIESTTISNESNSNNRSVLNVDRFSYFELLLTTILSQTVSLLVNREAGKFAFCFFSCVRLFDLFRFWSIQSIVVWHWRLNQFRIGSLANYVHWNCNVSKINFGIMPFTSFVFFSAFLDWKISMN